MTTLPITSEFITSLQAIVDYTKSIKNKLTQATNSHSIDSASINAMLYELYDIAVILLTSLALPGVSSEVTSILLEGLTLVTTELIESKHYNPITESFLKELTAYQDKLNEEQAAQRLFIEAEMIRHKDKFDTFDPMVRPASLSNHNYTDILLIVNNYHKSIKNPRSVLGLSQIEAEFLFNRCHPYLLQVLQEISLPAKHAQFSEVLKALHHLHTLLLNAGFKSLAIQSYREVISIMQKKEHFLKELPTAFASFAHILNDSSTFDLEKTDWYQSRQQLDALRGQLAKSLENAPAQGVNDFNNGVIKFTQLLLRKSETLLGSMDINYCVLSLGSLSQKMLCAFSDAEYAVVTEDFASADWENAGQIGTSSHYLKTLFELFEFKINCLGEKDKGYQLDDNSQPRTEPNLRGTAEQIVKRCLAIEIDGHDGLVYSLLHAQRLYGREKLFQKFQTSLQSAIIQPCDKPDRPTEPLSHEPVAWHRYWAIAQFKRNLREYEKYFIKKEEKPKLKAPYFKLLRFILLDFALYFNLPAHDHKEAALLLKNQGWLDNDWVEAILNHINELLIERCRLHLARQQEDDTAEARHTAQLAVIEQTILKPYFDTISLLVTHGMAVWQQAFWLNRSLSQFSLTPTPCEIKLLTPDLKPVDSTHAAKKLYLSSQWVKKIFKPDGNIEATTSGRNSAFFNIDDKHCIKITFPDDKAPATQEEALKNFMAREYAFNSLTCLLGYQITPPGCPIQLTFTSPTGNPIIYYGWLAKCLPGRTLKDVIENKPTDLDKIQVASYSALSMLNLLVFPEDQQPLNIYVEAVGSMIKLMSIDNKRIFNNLLQASFFISRANKLKLKSCLYLLEFMHHIVEEKLLKQYSRIDSKQLTTKWLEKLEQFDKLVGSVISIRSASSTGQASFKNIALDRFLPYIIPARFKMILEFLQGSPKAHTALLKRFEPEIFKYYEEMMQNGRSYYEIFSANYRTNRYNQQFSRSTLEFIKDNKITNQQLLETLLNQYPEFASNITWSECSDEEQVYWLELLLKIKNLRELNLRNCRMIEIKQLELLCKNSPGLTKIDISRCSNLKPQVFRIISRNAKQVNIIYCQNNFWLTKLDGNDNIKALNKLESFFLKGCKNLEIIDIKPSSVKYIYIDTGYTQIIAANDYAENFYKRAKLEYEQEQYEAAVKDLSQALKLNAENAYYFYDRAKAYFKLRKYEKSIADFNQLTSSNFKAVGEYYWYQGEAYYELKKYEKAVISYSQAIKFDTTISAWHRNRGHAYFCSKQYEEAIADYTQATKLDPKNDAYYYNLGNAYCKLEQYEKAIIDFTQAINLNFENSNYYYSRGQAYHALKQYEDALRDFSQAIEINPKRAHYYDGRSLTYYKLNHYKAAVKDSYHTINLHNPKWLEEKTDNKNTEKMILNVDSFSLEQFQTAIFAKDKTFLQVCIPTIELLCQAEEINQFLSKNKIQCLKILFELGEEVYYLDYNSRYAIAIFSLILWLEPNHYQARLALTNAARSIQENVLVKENIDYVEQQWPEDLIIGYFKVRWLAENMKQAEEANNLFKYLEAKFLKHNAETSQQLQKTRAYALSTIGQYENALAIFSNLIDSFIQKDNIIEHAKLYYGLIAILGKLNRYDEAIKIVQLSIELTDGWVCQIYLWHQLGEYQELTEQLEQAKISFQKAWEQIIKFGSTYPNLVDMKDIAYIKGNLAEKLNILATLVSNVAEPLYQAAVYFNNKNYDCALPLLLKMIPIYYNNPDCYAMLAVSHLETGNYTACLQACLDQLCYNPSVVENTDFNTSLMLYLIPSIINLDNANIGLAISTLFSYEQKKIYPLIIEILRLLKRDIILPLKIAAKLQILDKIELEQQDLEIVATINNSNLLEEILNSSTYRVKSNNNNFYYPVNTYKDTFLPSLSSSQEDKNLSKLFSSNNNVIDTNITSEQELAQFTYCQKIYSNYNLQIDGLIHLSMPRDGHCLYHAFGLYLNETQDYLRRIVAAHLEHNLDNFRSFIIPAHGKTIEDYINDVRNGIEWATHVEIEVLMRILNRPIVVIDPSGKISNQSSIASYQSEPIFVYYNGHNHYDALVLDNTYSAMHILERLLQNTNNYNRAEEAQQETLVPAQKALENNFSIEFNKNKAEKYYAKGKAALHCGDTQSAITFFQLAKDKYKYINKDSTLDDNAKVKVNKRLKKLWFCK